MNLLTTTSFFTRLRSRSFGLGGCLLASMMLAGSEARAQAEALQEEPAPTAPEPEPEPEPEPRLSARERQARFHDPRGTVFLGISGGASFSDGFNYGSIGASVGYAVLTGIVPGIRGDVLFGDLRGGELAGTLWLTPPIDFVVVPFAVGEAGHAWQSFTRADGEDVSRSGLLLGAGGGLHFGRPRDRFKLRAGVIYRYYDATGIPDSFGPLIVATFNFR